MACGTFRKSLETYHILNPVLRVKFGRQSSLKAVDECVSTKSQVIVTEGFFFFGGFIQTVDHDS